MFNKDFFPTPDNVIELMLEPYVWRNNTNTRKGLRKVKRILEPSAGKGDILDYINNEFGGYSGDRNIKKKMFAIEIEAELCSILKGKNYKIIASDFLDFQTHLSFDLILMNPPFSKGASHLLKAWKISKGGHIACLLNARTYDNPHTDERKYLKEIIDNNGTVERLGKVFSSTKDAERTTNAEIILIRLEKPKSLKEDDFLFNDLDGENHAFEAIDNIFELANNNRLAIYEASYKASLEAYKELLRAKAKLAHYQRGIYGNGEEPPKTNYAEQFQEYVEKSNISAWSEFLKKSKFSKYLTKKVRENFENSFEQQKLIAFSEKNMREMLEVLFHSQDGLLLDCIEEAFDEMTKYHKHNRIIENGKKSEGWKTNDCWRVNKKVILPNRLGIGWTNRFEFNYNYEQNLDDIDRGMCYVSGLDFEQITTIRTALKEKFEDVRLNGYSTSKNLTESTFFKMRFYKKGTLHLYFKNEYFWHQFNYLAAKKKGFPLPERMSFDTEYPAFVKD